VQLTAPSVYRSLHAYRHGYKLGRPCGPARHQQFEYDARAPDQIWSQLSAVFPASTATVAGSSVRRFVVAACAINKLVTVVRRHHYPAVTDAPPVIREAASATVLQRSLIRRPASLRQKTPVVITARQVPRPPSTPSLVYIYQKHDGGGTSGVPDRRPAWCLWSYQQLTSQLLLVCFLLASRLHWGERAEWVETKRTRTEKWSLDLDICWINTIVNCDTTMSVYLLRI